MNFEEFLDDEPKAPAAATPVDEATAESAEEEVVAEDNIDVQKAVVEALAADKAEQAETIAALRAENAELRKSIVELKKSISELTDRAESAKKQMLDQKAALEKVGDVLATNADNTGETRDHVIEVVREARDKAEAEGRLRRAQVLEGVLAANEPEGTLAKKRANLEKLFSDNGNIVSGPVIAELEKMGISHKNGEDYLLPAEIIKRNY